MNLDSLQFALANLYQAFDFQSGNHQYIPLTHNVLGITIKYTDKYKKRTVLLLNG